MNIVVKVTPENVDELYAIVLKYNSTHAQFVHNHPYLNLDTAWATDIEGAIPLFPLPYDSNYLSDTVKVSFEEFKEKLFNYLLEQ